MHHTPLARAGSQATEDADTRRGYAMRAVPVAGPIPHGRLPAPARSSHSERRRHTHRSRAARPHARSRPDRQRHPPLGADRRPNRRAHEPPKLGHPDDELRGGRLAGAVVGALGRRRRGRDAEREANGRCLTRARTTRSRPRGPREDGRGRKTLGPRPARAQSRARCARVAYSGAGRAASARSRGAPMVVPMSHVAGDALAGLRAARGCPAAAPQRGPAIRVEAHHDLRPPQHAAAELLGPERHEAESRLRPVVAPPVAVVRRHRGVRLVHQDPLRDPALVPGVVRAR
jgi:hypothetical protein